jgi:Flp pilus assembly protein TadG
MIKQLRMRAESGFGVTTQGIVYFLLLVMTFGLIFDIGNVLYASARLRSTVIAAAQDAAKRVDADVLLRDQILTFTPGTAEYAVSYVVANAGPLLRAGTTHARIARAPGRPNYLYIEVDASATVPMAVIGQFGIKPITLNASARAEAVSGVNGAHE